MGEAQCVAAGGGAASFILVVVVAGLVLAVVLGVFILQSKQPSHNTNTAVAPNSDKSKRPPAKSQFQEWKEENEMLQSHGVVTTTLEHQIALASRLWNEAMGKTEAAVSATAQTQEILEALQAAPVDGKESIVSWKGFHVGWFLDFFCKTPYMEKLLEFGCELWFVRKVCIIEIIRQARCAVNKDITEVPVLSGSFVDFMDTVVSGLGLEGDTDEIVKTPTTFIAYTGGYTVREMLEMLHQLDPNEIVWMDVFCVNQFAWTGKSRSPEMRVFKETYLGGLETQIQAINNTALLVGDWKNVMATLGQIWVLWEIFCSVEAGAELNVVLPPAQAHDFVQNCLESNGDFDGIMRSLASIDVNHAIAQEDCDQQVIFARIQGVGLSNVNNAVSGAVRGWLYQQGQEHLKERRKSKDGPSALLLNNLGRLLTEQGNLQEAEPLFREALDKRQKVLGRDHPDTLTSLSNLATLLKDQGKLDEAEPLFREDLAKSQEVLGHDHPATLVSLNNLAGLLHDQGMLDVAEPLFREALEKSQKVLGRCHPDTLVSVGNLATLLQAQGRLEEAEPLFREALETKQKVLGSGHPDTLTSLNNLAGLLWAKGKLDEAEPLFREDLEKSQKLLGRDHPTTLNSINNLAGLLRDQGKPDEAEPMFREALQKKQTALGGDHPDTLASLSHLAGFLWAEGRFDEAEPLFREALEKSQNILNRDHPNTLTALNNLALLFHDEGKLDEAEPLYREALERSQKLLGHVHPSTLIPMCNLALLLHQRGGSAHLEESKALLWYCKTTSLAELGADHPDTIARCEHWDDLFGLAAQQHDFQGIGVAPPLSSKCLESELRYAGHATAPSSPGT